MKENKREVLVDKSSTGRVRPWKQLKLKATELSNIYDLLYLEELQKTLYDVPPEHWSKKSKRLLGCGTILTFDVYQNGEKKLTSADSCRVRLCPLCSWRRSLKIQAHARKIFDYIGSENYQYIFLTLTVPNCTGEELSKKLDDMFSAWNKFMGYKKIKNIVRGWYRALEVTHNVNPKSESFDTYHPHFHCILVVPKSYFQKAYYIPRDEWLALWQKAMRDKSITQVDVRKVKDKNGNGDIVSAVCEAAKYTVKSSDYILPQNWNLSAKTVRVLDMALANRRLVAYGGILKDAHKILNLDDEVDGDLVHIDDDSMKGKVVEQIIATWSVGYQEYYIT